MPKFIVTTPDGQKIEVNAPDGATQDDAIEYVASTWKPAPAAKAEAPSFFEKLGNKAIEAGDFVQGLFADKPESVLQGKVLEAPAGMTPDVSLDANRDARNRSRSPDSVMFTKANATDKANAAVAQGKKVLAGGVDAFRKANDSGEDGTLLKEKADEFRSIGEWAGDSFSAIKSGTLSLAQLPTNIIAPGSALADTFREVQKDFAAEESEPVKAQRAMMRKRIDEEEGFLGKYVETLTSLVANPSLGIQEGVKQIPNFIGILGASKAVAGLAGGSVALAGRVSPTLALGEAISGGAIATRAAGIGATAGGALAAGGMSGGDAAGATYEGVMAAKQEFLDENPDYRKLVDEKGMDPYEARKEIATAKARMAALIAAPMGMVFGYGGAEAAMVASGIAKAVGRNAPKQGFAKIVAKELIGENIDEGLTNVIGNNQIRTVDPTQKWDEGLAEAMATATVTAGPFAGVAALSEGGRESERFVPLTMNPNLRNVPADAPNTPPPAPKVEDQPTTPVAPVVPATGLQSILQREGLTGEQTPEAPAAQAPKVNPAPAADTAAPQVPTAPGDVAGPADVAAQPLATGSLSNPAPAIPTATDPRSSVLAELDARLAEAKAQQVAAAEQQAAVAQAEAAAVASEGSNYQQKTADATQPAGDVVPALNPAPAIVGAAKVVAEKYSDLADATQYPDQVLARIADRPEANAELKSAVAIEQTRRATEATKATEAAEAGRTQALSGESATFVEPQAPRPLSVERGLEIATASRDRALLPQEKAYMDALKSEIGGTAFSLVQREGARPYAVRAEERKFDLPRIIEENNRAIAQWNWDAKGREQGETQPAAPTAAAPATAAPAKAEPLVQMYTSSTLSPQAQSLQQRMQQRMQQEQNAANGTNTTTASPGVGSPAGGAPVLAPAFTQRLGDTPAVVGAVNGGQPSLSSKPAAGGSTQAAQPSRLKLAPAAPQRVINDVGTQLFNDRKVMIAPYKGQLTHGQQVASVFANMNGRTFTVVEQKLGPQNAMPNGFMIPGTKHIVVDSKAGDAPLLVAVHEIYHGMPARIRTSLNTALRSLFDPTKEAEFGRIFSVDAKDFEEEIPAYIAQATASRESFWDEVRTKMGNRDFAELAKYILTNFKRLLQGADTQLGEGFLQKYIGEESKILQAQSLLAEAYTQSMREQGMEPDAEVTGGLRYAQKPNDFTDPEERTTVSTAQPWAKADRKTGYQPNSYTEKRVIDGDDIRASKTHVEKIASALRNYNTLTGKGNPEKLMAELHSLVVENLLWLHDHVKPEVRARAKLWYDGANRIANDWTGKFGINTRQASGILAVFSPQMDWFKNVSLAERALVVLKDHGTERWSDGMTQWAESWVKASTSVETKVARQAQVTKMRAIAEGGKALSELEPEDASYFIRAFDEAYFPRSYRLITPEGGFGDFVEKGTAIESESDTEGEESGDSASVTWGGFGTIEKAVKIYRDNSFKTVDLELGGEHKVRNFYNNIVEPNSADGHVTIDTHAVAAALIKALSGASEEVKHNLGGLGSTAATGASGSYALFADAYRDAASQRGILAREMQSITWEAVRSLFPASLKKGMSDKVSAAWDLVKSGEITREEAREQVLALSKQTGGDKAFAWENGGSGAFAKDGATSFDAAVATNPADREVRTMPPAAAKDKVSVSLSAATNSIPGIKDLYDRAQKGDTAAHALLQDIAQDSLLHLLGGTSAKVQFEPATGLYGGASEPSMAVTVTFTDTDRTAVLAALAKFADNFNQEQVHVRQGTKEKRLVKYDDGSYVTPVYQWKLDKALTTKQIQKVIDQSGLYGLTFGDGFVEAYYVGDTDNDTDRDKFFENAGRADALLGRSGATLSKSRARLWPYGHGDGAIGYGNIRGDVTPGQATSSKTAKRVAEYLTGSKVKTFEQAEITPKQAALQTAIAKAYEALPDNDLKNPRVRRAYTELGKEVVRQFKALPIKVEVMTGQGEPYRNSDAMRQDVADNNHVYIYGTTADTFGPPGEDFSAHPLLADTGLKDINGYPLLANDLLRAVHDYYAHTLSAVQFGPKGEEAAWKNHMAMTNSPWARWALTAETRGQNSWVNFNAGLDKATPIKDRPFARQKAALLPAEYSLTGDKTVDGPMKAFIAGLSEKEQIGSKPIAFSNKAHNLDQDITLDIPLDNGKTAKMTVNAQRYITQLDAREDALRMVKECML